jgi:hypothetical protein
MIESLQEALQDQASQHAPLSKWIETAQDEKLWNDIIDEWYKVTCQVFYTVIYLEMNVKEAMGWVRGIRMGTLQRHQHHNHQQCQIHNKWQGVS